MQVLRHQIATPYGQSPRHRADAVRRTTPLIGVHLHAIRAPGIWRRPVRGTTIHFRGFGAPLKLGRRPRGNCTSPFPANLMETIGTAHESRTWNHDFQFLAGSCPRHGVAANNGPRITEVVRKRLRRTSAEDSYVKMTSRRLRRRRPQTCVEIKFRTPRAIDASP